MQKITGRFDRTSFPGAALNDLHSTSATEQHETSSCSPLKIAAVTMVYNESVFLPIWKQYYGNSIGEDNLFILDYGSDDGSCDDLAPASKLRLPRGEFDEDQRAEFISKFQSSLLCYYDAVIFSDTDEILIPDPEKYVTFHDYIRQRCTHYVNAVGVEVLHLPDIETDMDLRQPLLGQRRYAQFSASYCKPLISRVPLLWDAGFHSCNYPPAIDPHLFLFHLKRMDQKIALHKQRLMRSTAWSKNMLAKGQGVQGRLDDDQFIETMFPFSQETIQSILTKDFEFSADIEKLETIAADRPNIYIDFQGAAAAIPKKFHNSITGSGAPSNDC